jgi:hypothetical protein
MKIGVHYKSYNDACIILYVLCDSKYKIQDESTDFTFYYNNDEYVFSKEIDIINQCDYKIKLFHTFYEWKSFKGYDKLIQSQTVENYHVYNDELKEYLDAGNICLSSASISFEHPNFYYDPIFNLIYFYNTLGFNFLNYHQFDKKENLLGVYHKPNNGININKSDRNYLYFKINDIVKSDFKSYESSDYNLKSLLQPYTTFGHWINNHITSYLDFTTSVCNVMFETLGSPGNMNGLERGKMYARQYITEKTLKSIAFSEENIFFIWYGPTKLYKYLIEFGFWFLNYEFYDESIELSYGHDELSILYPNISYSHMEQSVVDTSIYLKKLKEEYKTNKEVHNYLMKTYGHKLQKNVELLKEILSSYSKKENVLNLIKNGNRN